MTQQLQTTEAPAPDPCARVRFLASVGPTPTDRTVYQAGSEWTVSLARAEQLEADGEAEVLEILDAPAPAPSPAPAEAVGDVFNPDEE